MFCLAAGLLPGIATSNSNLHLQDEAQIAGDAESAIKAGKPDEARVLLERSVKAHPRSGTLYNLLGIVAAEQSRYSEAEAAFAKAVEYSPRSPSVLLNYARALNQAGKRKRARDTYERALALDPDSVEAHANLTALLLDTGDYAAVLHHLGRLPTSTRNENGFRAISIAALAGEGKINEADSEIQQLNKDLTEQDVSLPAYVLTQVNQPLLAIALLSHVGGEISSRDLRGLLATAYEKTGKYDQARSLFESMASEEPGSPQPLFEAAHAAYGQRDYEGAAGYLIRALKLNPASAEGQFFFGIVCVDLNLAGDALQALKEADRLEPNNPSFIYALGAVTMSSENKTGAVELFEKYIRLRPADPHGKLALGVARFEAAEPEAAQRILTPLLSDPSVSAGAHYILGKICRQKNDLEGAADHFKAAIEIQSSDALLWANLGAVYLRANQLADARQALDRALALDPNSFLANEYLLSLLRKQKDPGAEEQAVRFNALSRKASEDQQLLFRHISAK